MTGRHAAARALSGFWLATPWLSGAVLSWALLGGAVLGCGAERREAKELLASIDRMRETRGAARLPLLEALEQKTLEGEAAERVRKACTEAYRALHDANARLDDTRKKLAQVRAKGERDTPLLAKLLEATRLLQGAQTAHQRCREEVTKLRASLH